VLPAVFAASSLFAASWFSLRFSFKLGLATSTWPSLLPRLCSPPVVCVRGRGREAERERERERRERTRVCVVVVASPRYYSRTLWTL